MARHLHSKEMRPFFLSRFESPAMRWAGGWMRCVAWLGVVVLASWVLGQARAGDLDRARSQWDAIIASGRQQELKSQLRQVNNQVNRRLAFRDDMQIWGREDFWATPLEALGVGAGDCEDFSIAKYVALLQLGIPDSRLRLIYVRANQPTAGGLSKQVAHMVLGYYPTPDATPWILDNLVVDILPANQRTDLYPVFSFNATGLWAGGQRASVSPGARLSRWRDLLLRLQQEGSLPAPTAGQSKGIR